MSETLLESENKYTLSSWLDIWLETYKRFSVKAKTYELYSFIISLIKNCPESEKTLHNITEIDLQNILNRLFTKKYSKSTISKARYTLRQCFSRAIRLNYIGKNPTEDLVLPAAPTKTVYPLTGDEQVQVEQACKRDALGHLFIFLLRTGLRRAELINLTWADYDTKAQEIHHIKKHRAGYSVLVIPLIPKVLVALNIDIYVVIIEMK